MFTTYTAWQENDRRMATAWFWKLHYGAVWRRSLAKGVKGTIVPFPDHIL